MALVDILVHMDSTPHCPARLDLAIGLARQHRARLTGLYVMAHDYYHPQDERATSAALCRAGHRCPARASSTRTRARPRTVS